MALQRARSSYERAHVLAGARGVLIAGVLSLAAVQLHRTTQLTWLVASLLAATLATLGWRGGAWRRGAVAGVLAGLPVFIAPTIVFWISHAPRCPDCPLGPTLGCMLTCFGTSSLVGIVVGVTAMRDTSPRRYAAGSLATAILTGLLGCATTGLGGATGIVIGLVAGSVTGWVVAGRTAHA
jgi:hypothetical protein